ncbi:RNA polymerase sigma-70 factor [Prolixibacteraceae bacterium Z1-6]|uniref:RNA polymerase sigma-70 factor n=1 Tax=Draconibacterium aestuarii TaxID=2998507 RepID=A0A9X3J5Q9_9BACT|nr:RNA polymerase sigma-70 factor [Prolixibacteraceae bacterium Z1-6]
MWLTGLYGGGKEKMGIEEFQKIFLELYPDLCVYASSFVIDVASSKDIVQDVFTTFWIENDKLINKKLIKPYLFKSVKHKALNYKKREKRKSGLDELFSSFTEELANSENETVEAFLSYSNLQSDLEMAIQELPEQRQLIFRMSRFEEMKHKEIAKELNISPKTVETQIYRTLKFLKAKLKHHL